MTTSTVIIEGIVMVGAGDKPRAMVNLSLKFTMIQSPAVSEGGL